MNNNRLMSAYDENGYVGEIDLESIKNTEAVLTLLDDPEITKTKPNKHGDCAMCYCFDCSGCNHYNF